MDYNQEFALEKEYLESTQKFISTALEKELESISDEKGRIIDARKNMWENVSFKGGFDNAVEAIQVLEGIQNQAASYNAANERIELYQKALESPYFARIDFTEKGQTICDKIYIGLSTLMDEDTYETYVYDWRAPICSIFYQYEVGPVEYKAPSGTIRGEVTLKRQYDITNGTLNYFFDADVNIQDEMLRAALSQNSSPTMRSIVETIQRQQDMIIRDTQNELLIVQGVAGSGKTSVALHRVAFLLYQGVSKKLSANNILIISPNNLFGSYIANVLPELGEKNIGSYTFDNLFAQSVPPSPEIQSRTLASRNEHLEEMICSEKKQRAFLHSQTEFLSSRTFVIILERYLNYFSRRLIPFEDIYYNGKVVMTRQEMKSSFLCGNRDIPIQKALSLVEKRIWTEIHKEQKERREKIQGFLRPRLEHQYDYVNFGRLLSIKENGRLKRQIKDFTSINCFQLYVNLLGNRELFYQLASGLELPENIEKILDTTAKQLQTPTLRHENLLPLLYLSLRIYGRGNASDIRQVVVDEAQDYYPIHFEVLKYLFPEARYTIMGDLNQTIEKQADMSLYESIETILKKRTSCTITLKKGFRCSTEINQFSSQFLEDTSGLESFERHEQAPRVISCQDETALVQHIGKTIRVYQANGLKSIGILCKSEKECNILADKMTQILPDMPFKMLDTSKREIFSGVMLMPIYMAKGLEFDGAITVHTDDENYHDPYDKKLLYIASTRALHQLTFLYCGKPSRFISAENLGSQTAQE